MRLLLPMIAAAAAPALAQHTVSPTVIAKTGDLAPADRAGPLYYRGFAALPVVNAYGQMAFSAQLGATPAGATSVRALFSTRSGALEPVAFDDTPIANVNNIDRMWAPFSQSTRLYLADNGRLVVSSQISPAFPSNSSNSSAVMALEPDESDWTFVAHNGKEFPVPGGVGIGPILSFPAVRADGGRIGFPGYASADSQRVYLIETADGFERSLLVNSTPAIDSQSVMATSGDFAVAMEYFPDAPVVIRGRLGGEQGMGPELVRTGDVLSFDNAPGHWVISPEYSTPRINGAGQMVLFGTVHDADVPGSPELVVAVRLSPSGARLLARQGDPVPGRPGLVWSAQDHSITRQMAICDTGVSAWFLGVAGAGVDDTNDTVLAVFGNEPTGATIVAREGDAVFDLPGAVYTSFRPSLTPYGLLSFRAGTRVGDAPSVTALFAVDINGRARMLLRDTYTSMVIPGIGAPTVTLSLIQSGSGGNDGLARSMSANGQTAAIVRFDGGQAVVVLSIPCPADIAATGAVTGYDGVLDNNDFVMFIDRLFTGDPRADCGTTGGVHGSDGAFDNNDFVVFVDDFFDGCE